MAQSRLYIWEDNQERPRTKHVAQDYTVILMCMFITIFILYGAVSAMLDNLITAFLAGLDSKADTLPVDAIEELGRFALYILLVVTIQFVGNATMRGAERLNGDKQVFDNNHIKLVMNRAMIASAVFFLAYAIRDKSHLYSFFAAAQINFVGGCFISVGNFKGSKKRKRVKYSLQKKSTCMQIDTLFVFCLIVLPLTVLLDCVANRYLFEFSIVWVIVVILMIALCTIDAYDRNQVKKNISNCNLGENILLYGHESYGTLLHNKIYRLVRSKCTSKRNAAKWVGNRMYNTIIIVDPFGSETKSKFMTDMASKLLAPDGVVIAPSYTSTKDGSRLLSPEAYKAKLEGLGFNTKKEFTSKFRQITYIEISKV